MPGWVYFIRAGNSPRIKVGFTRKQVSIRLSCLQVGSLGIPLAVEHSFHVTEPEIVEGLVHADLRRFRVRGEWFELDEETLSAYIEAFEEVRLPEFVSG